ncbi:hypothetical protein KIPB_016592, partial [Kipferlia bialata]|eukprot:g16592.t1
MPPPSLSECLYLLFDVLPTHLLTVCPEYAHTPVYEGAAGLLHALSWVSSRRDATLS